MKKIKLFHSYIYIHNSKNIKHINNKIYDNNNNFILGLLNIPQEQDLYKILIQKNLISNKLSKKKTLLHSYYNKNNAKVYVEVDCDKLLQYINNNKVIPYKTELFALLKQNYVHLLDSNKNIFEVICLNKNCRKDISKMEDIHYQHIDPYILDTYELSFNIKSHTISKKTNIIHSKSLKPVKSSSHGHLFICDNLEHTMTTFYNMIKDMSFKTIIISKYHNVWLQYLQTYNIPCTNILSKSKHGVVVVCNTNKIKFINQYYDRVIYDNIDQPISINCQQKWYISENVNQISTQCLQTILKNYLDIDITYIDENVLYSLSKIIYYKNYLEYYLKTKTITINYHNLNNLKLPKYEPIVIQPNEIKILNDMCCVCYHPYTIQTLCKTTCQPIPHYFCKSCITKIISSSNSCPSCRQKIDNSKVKKLIYEPTKIMETNNTKDMCYFLVKLFSKNIEHIICVSGNKYQKLIKTTCGILNMELKSINNESNLSKYINTQNRNSKKDIIIINLNNFDYTFVKNVIKRKKVELISINNDKNDINKFIINLKQYYETINCESLSN